MTDDRPLTLRRLAARVASASHDTYEEAVHRRLQSYYHETGVMPSTIDQAMDILATETIRMYVSAKKRRWRAVNRSIRELLAAGVPPPAISERLRCTVRHVYNVRRAWVSQSKAPSESVAVKAPEAESSPA